MSKNYKSKFTIKDDALLNIIQDADKSSEALVISRSLSLAILINFQSLQGNTGTNKTYVLIKGTYFVEDSFKIAIDADSIPFGNIHSVTSTENCQKDHLTQWPAATYPLLATFQEKHIFTHMHTPSHK